MSATSVRVVFETLGQGRRAARVARDDENRVVAGDRADGLGQLRAVDRDRPAAAPGRAPVRTTTSCCDAVDAAQELGGRALERGERRLRVRRVGARALVGAVAGALDQAEIRDVARNRRLRGVEAALAQTAAQLLLAVERLAVDEFENQRLAACLHQLSPGMDDYTSIFVDSQPHAVYKYSF